MTDLFVLTRITEACQLEIAIIGSGISLSVETLKVISVRGDRIVHLVILRIKVVLKAPQGDAEESRLRKQVRP